MITQTLTSMWTGAKAWFPRRRPSAEELAEEVSFQLAYDDSFKMEIAALMAGSFDVDEIAQQVDVHDVAYSLDINDIASEVVDYIDIDYDELGENVDMDSLAENVSEHLNVTDQIDYARINEELDYDQIFLVQEVDEQDVLNLMPSIDAIIEEIVSRLEGN